MAEINGRCLCGAVTVRAEIDNPVLRACHCEMCRQHTSGAFVSIKTVPGSVVVEGPAKLDVESDWSVRVLEGRLRANVPPAARGFIVKAADSEIVDLGTGVAVIANNTWTAIQAAD